MLFPPALRCDDARCRIERGAGGGSTFVWLEESEASEQSEARRRFARDSIVVPEPEPEPEEDVVEVVGDGEGSKPIEAGLERGASRRVEASDVLRLRGRAIQARRGCVRWGWEWDKEGTVVAALDEDDFVRDDSEHASSSVASSMSSGTSITILQLLEKLEENYQHKCGKSAQRRNGA